MNDILLLTISLIISLMVGLLIGILFFVGLWWTIRIGLRSAHPAILFLASLLLRTTFALSGFYFAAVGLNRFQYDHQLARLISCLFGFLLIRIIVSGSR